MFNSAFTFFSHRSKNITMTSYQNSIHKYSNFTQKSTGTSKNSTYDITLASRAKQKKEKKKPTTAVQRKKLYSASGQAPAPSKDFYELSVYKKEVIWRKWRIRYSRDGKVVPSEDKMDIEKFLDSDVIHNDIERNLGDDVLNMAIGHLTNVWLSRLPIHVLNIIMTYLDIKDIGRLHQVLLSFVHNFVVH